MKPTENDRLYQVLKNQICSRIFHGEYPDGAYLPAERTLAESFGISRVTVRKGLALLEADGILHRVRGSGNRVGLAQAGYRGSMDLIAVLAHGQNVFFASFIDTFQRTAEAKDSLVLFKRSPPGERLEESLFKLFQKNIRNAVIWLEDQRIDLEYLRRLRGLGMNMVFFDVVVPSPYADCVLLHNEAAIRTLSRCLADRGAHRLGYVGWDNETISSVREREQAFTRLEPGPAFIQRVSWSERGNLGTASEQLADRLKRAAHPPEAILCGDGEIGVAIKKALLSRGLAGIQVASPDEYPESRALAIQVYAQDFGKMAERTLQCLVDQNRPGWTASIYPIDGELVPASR